MKLFVEHEIMNPSAVACKDYVFEKDTTWNVRFEGMNEFLQLRVVNITRITEESDRFDEWNW